MRTKGTMWGKAQSSLEDAVESYSLAAETTDGVLGLGYLGKTYAELGRVDDARAILARMDRESESRYISPLDWALVHSGFGEFDGDFRAPRRGLRAACERPCAPQAPPLAGGGEVGFPLRGPRAPPWPPPLTSGSSFPRPRESKMRCLGPTAGDG